MASNTTTGGSVVWNFDVDKRSFDTGLSKAKTDVDKFGTELKKSSGGIKDWAGQASNSFNGIAAGIAGLAKSIAAVTIGAGGLGAIFLKSAADMQSTAKQFDVLIGNTEISNALFAQLAEFAAKTPFEFPEIAKAGKTLLGFGISSDKVFGNIKTLGDIAAATGADFNALSVVFGQVNATGRLMGQDALQLINNNVPITTILAKKLGVSVKDVKQRMEDGAISADLFNEALLNVTQQGGFAFGGMEQLAGTFQGRMSTLKDTALELGRNLLGVFVNTDPAKGPLGFSVKPGGIFDRLTKALPNITKAVQEMTPKLTKMVDVLIDNGPTVIAVLSAITAMFVAAKVAAVILGIIAAGMGGAIAALIIGLVGVFTFLQIRFQFFNKLWDEIKKAAQPLVNFFNESILPALKAIWAAIVQNLWPALQQLWTAFQRILAALQPALTNVLKILGVILLVILVGAVLAFLAILNVLIQAFSFVISVISNVINWIANLISWIGNLIGWFINLWKEQIKVFSNIKNGISDAIGFVIEIFKAFGPDILRAVGRLGNLLYDVGRDVVTGFIRGIKDMLNDVKRVAGDLGNAVKDKVKGVLGIRSPSLVFQELGMDSMAGYIKGIEKGSADVMSTMTDSFASSMFSPTVSTMVTDTDVAGQQETQVGKNVTVEMNLSGVVARSRSEWRDIMKDGIEAVNEELRSRGLPQIADGKVTGSTING